VETRVADAYDVPTATEAYARAWYPLRHWFMELLFVAIAWSVLASPAGIARHAGDHAFATMYYTFVVVPLNFGALNAYLHAVRGRAPRVGHLIEPFRRAYPQIVLAHLAWVAVVSLGLVMLVVPGLIVATRLAFVAFLVMDEDMGALEAIRESWRRTEGHAATIFGVWVLGVPLALLGLLAFGVGIVPALLWTHLAFATVFDEVTASEAPPDPSFTP
jgi:uncharacterized membrane protein